MPAAIVIDTSGRNRCAWCVSDPLYVAYHDREWGVPVLDDQRLFEKLCLEGFQCGLSWLTILRKRDRFREVFHGFEIARVASMTGRDVARLVKDPGIVRHRGKIESTINNARRCLELMDEHSSLAAFVWTFEPRTRGALESWPPPATSPESTALSKALRKRGFSFVGPTTMYAFMQAVGLVNDHARRCFVRESVESKRRRLRRPHAHLIELQREEKLPERRTGD